MLEDIKKAGAKYLKTPIKSLTYSKFKIFKQTGSRVEYEADYIEHRRRLNVFAALALSSDDKKWLHGLEDIIWAICDEFTWALPAHIYNDPPVQEYDKVIDLFASETGFALSEILYLFKDRLSPLVADRAEYEIRRRIINPYLESDIKWGKNNWSAVCAGSIGVIMMYLCSRQEFEQVKDRISASINDFLDSYNDDGCCLEGPLYWAYGFGYFCFFATMLREYTKGEINLFENEKVKRIAQFGQKMYLADNIIIPFADAPHNLNYNIGLAHFLANEYEDISAFDEKYEAKFGDDKRYRFADFIRNFYWYDETLRKNNKKNNDYYIMKDSQWYIKKVGNMAFAAKGGKNNEPHNHNDIGCFVLLYNKKFIIDDLGWPEYVRGYFGEDRYKNVCASSRGHSVPIIDGEYQKAGKQHYAELLEGNEDTFSLDITKAYSLKNLKKAVRRFNVNENKVIITDLFQGEIKNITERFVTRIKPEIRGSMVIIGQMKIKCDKETKISISEENFTPRLSICKMDMKPIETAYFIDFNFNDIRDNFTVTFKIDINQSV